MKEQTLKKQIAAVLATASLTCCAFVLPQLTAAPEASAAALTLPTQQGYALGAIGGAGEHLFAADEFDDELDDIDDELDDIDDDIDDIDDDIDDIDDDIDDIDDDDDDDDDDI